MKFVTRHLSLTLNLYKFGALFAILCQLTVVVKLIKACCMTDTCGFLTMISIMCLMLLLLSLF